jgi:hypothetical protein
MPRAQNAQLNLFAQLVSKVTTTTQLQFHRQQRLTVMSVIATVRLALEKLRTNVPSVIFSTVDSSIQQPTSASIKVSAQQLSLVMDSLTQQIQNVLPVTQSVPSASETILQIVTNVSTDILSQQPPVLNVTLSAQSVLDQATLSAKSARNHTSLKDQPVPSYAHTVSTTLVVTTVVPSAQRVARLVNPIPIVMIVPKVTITIVTTSA